MQPEFWHQRWATNQIGFHEGEPNPLLVAHCDALALPRGARVFVPLCGKTLDIDWLLARGYSVVGIELSELAVGEVFKRLARQPERRVVGALQCCCTEGLEVFVGDFFQLTSQMLGPVSAVYDRASLIALPAPMRLRYAGHLRSITCEAPQLLITLDYDQQLAEGPPFSVAAGEVRKHYFGRVPSLLSSQHLPTGMKGRFAATESVWLVP